MRVGQLEVALGSLVDRLDPRVGELQLAALTVVGHRLGGIAVAQGTPSFALCRIGCAVNLAQLGARHAFLQAREHPAGTDRRELAGVADEDERATALIDRRGQAGEPVGVTHAGFVEVDRRLGIERRLFVPDRVDVAVERVHAARLRARLGRRHRSRRPCRFRPGR